MTTHLTIGGSTATRSLACPGWIKRAARVTPRPAGPAAIDGSMHHAVMELCLNNDTEPNDNEGFVYEEGGVTRVFVEDDLGLSYLAFKAINALFDEYDIEDFVVEPFVQIVPGEIGGSIDVLALSRDGATILVVDYKFGRVRVTADGNDQLKLYASAAMTDDFTRDMFSRVENIIGVIIQPQAKETVSQCRYSADEIVRFKQDIIATSRVASGDNPPVNPGKHCQYCPAAPYCPEKRAAALSATLLDARSANELSEAAAHVQEVEDWLKMVREEMYMQMKRGVVIDGWKIVDKQSKNRWIDADQEAAAEAELRKKRFLVRDIRVNRLITAPVALKLAKKRGSKIDLEKFITKSSPGTTIATSDDARDAVVVTDVQGHLADMMGNKL